MTQVGFETLGNSGAFGKLKMLHLKSLMLESLNITLHLTENFQVSFGTQEAVCHFHHLPDLQIHRLLILRPMLL